MSVVKVLKKKIIIILDDDLFKSIAEWETQLLS
jgi:hypothetical protein